MTTLLKYMIKFLKDEESETQIVNIAAMLEFGYPSP